VFTVASVALDNAYKCAFLIRGLEAMASFPTRVINFTVSIQIKIHFISLILLFSIDLTFSV